MSIAFDLREGHPTPTLARGRSSSAELSSEVAKVITGLSATPPTLSPKWFYDSLGSALFEAITRLPEYYPTRTERSIFRSFGPEIGRALPPGITVAEPGSGSSEKIECLLAHLRSPRAYHPMDISPAALKATEQATRVSHPELEVRGLVGDFSDPAGLDALFAPLRQVAPLLIFFPGGTLGNFHPVEASALLAAMAKRVHRGAYLLLGVDRVKDAALLEAAYADRTGVTAAFNRNALGHLNRTLGATFDVEGWRHVVRYNTEVCRVEMWLICDRDQDVRLGDRVFEFRRGQGIHTECAYKYDRQRLLSVVGAAGFTLVETWTDSKAWFCEALFRSSG